MVQRRTHARLLLRSFTFPEILKFLSGWSPATSRGVRWTDWDQYLRDFESIRPELLAAFRSGPRAAFPPVFGDRAIAYRKRFGREALELADYQTLREFDPKADA